MDRKLILVKLAMLVFLQHCQTSQESVAITQLQFDQMHYNFGSVNPQDRLRHTFLVKNTGKYPLSLLDVTGSCSCTQIAFSRKPILPGGVEKITLTISTVNKTGYQKNFVKVLTNTIPKAHFLYYSLFIKSRGQNKKILKKPEKGLLRNK